MFYKLSLSPIILLDSSVQLLLQLYIYKALYSMCVIHCLLTHPLCDIIAEHFLVGYATTFDIIYLPGS